MKTILTKRQTSELIKLGADIPLESITPYEEVLKTHAYSVGNHWERNVISPQETRTTSPDGIMFKIYSNLSLGDLMNRIPPFIPYGEPFTYEGAYMFEVVQQDKKWVARFRDDTKFLFLSTEHDEMIDSVFEAYCFVLQYNGGLDVSEMNIPVIEDDDFSDDDYFFSGKF